MSEQINLEYAFTENEYVKAVQAFNSCAHHTRFLIFPSLFVFLVGLVVIRVFGNDNVFGLILFFVGFIFSVSSYHSHFVIPRQYFNRNPELGQFCNLQCSDSGLFFNTNNTESRLEWSYFREIWETSEFYFLFSGKDAPAIIPKRAFTSKQQETLFRELIRRKINPKIQSYNFFGLKKSSEHKAEQILPQTPPDWR